MKETLQVVTMLESSRAMVFVLCVLAGVTGEQKESGGEREAQAG